MKIVKPMAVSYSFRTFQIVGRQELCVTSLVGFALGSGVRRLVPDIALWPAIGEVVPGIVDEGLPKARGEVLAYGSCHTPGALPLPSTMVRLRVARPGTAEDQPALVDKQLAVFGDRFWTDTASRDPEELPIPSSSEATAPVPFTKMPLGWERAFGGPTFTKNPLGRGMHRVEAEEGIHRLPLPNVELASSLVTRSSQRPEPAGYGPLDLSWPQRQELAGTYGGSWLEEDFPGYARDTEPAFFNTAPPDQRIEGYFGGDEEYVLEGLHPVRVSLRGKLPRAAARVFLRRKGSDALEDVKMTLDTLVFLPGQELGILVFRGMTPVLEDDASDVAVALAACEDLDAPRTVEHYTAALARRLDKDQSPLLALHEGDLLPGFAAGTGLGELFGKRKSTTKDARERIIGRAVARARQELVDAGVEDPDAVIAKATEKSPLVARLERLPDPADPKDLAEYATALQQLDAYMEEQIEQSQAAAARQLEADQAAYNREIDDLGPRATPQMEQLRRETNEKFDQARRTLEGEPPPADAAPTGDGPPARQAPGMLAMYREAEIEPDPSVVKKLEDADAAALEMYRETAHYVPPVRMLDDETRKGRRRAALETRAIGKSLAELDWTRCDLSGLDFGRVDLRRGLLEGADLTKTNLAAADLSGAVLAHATLRDTCLDGATLEDANLGASRVEGATFVSANLRRAILGFAKLSSASFRGADLTGVDWFQADLGAVDFERANVEKATFFAPIKLGGGRASTPKEAPVPRDLTRCRFPHARLKKSNFVRCKLDGIDFTGADLELVTFLTVSANGACFRGASLRKLHAVMGCSLAGAVFEGADLRDAFLRGADLRGANFDGAILDGADLSECDLTGATMTRAQARSALLIRSDLTRVKAPGTNFMEAMLQNARLHGADVRGANLFAANLGRVRLDEATQVHGANLERALMLPRARKS